MSQCTSCVCVHPSKVPTAPLLGESRESGISALTSLADGRIICMESYRELYTHGLYRQANTDYTHKQHCIYRGDKTCMCTCKTDVPNQLFHELVVEFVTDLRCRWTGLAAIVRLYCVFAMNLNRIRVLATLVQPNIEAWRGTNACGHSTPWP